MNENVKKALNDLIGKEVRFAFKGVLITFKPLEKVYFLAKQDIYPYESICLSTKIPYDDSARVFARICIYDLDKIEIKSNKIVFNKGLDSQISVILKMGEC